jgi:hypothetical protein
MATTTSSGTVYIYNRSPFDQNFNVNLYKVIDGVGDKFTVNSKLGYTLVASYDKNDNTGKSTVYAGAPFNSYFSSNELLTNKDAPYLSGGTVLVASTIPSQDTTTVWLEYFKNGTSSPLLDGNTSANLGLQINLAGINRGGAIYSAPDVSNQNNKEGIVVDRAAVMSGNGTLIPPPDSSEYNNYGISTYVDKDSKYCLSLGYRKSDNKPVIFLHDFQGPLGESNNSIVINGDNNTLYGSYGSVAGSNNTIREYTYSTGIFGDNNTIISGVSSAYIFGSDIVATKSNTLYVENLFASASARVQGDTYTRNLNLRDRVLITPNVETSVFSVTALNEFLEIRHKGKVKYIRLYDISVEGEFVLDESGDVITTENDIPIELE